MSDELKISYRVRQLLDGGVDSLDRRLANRLESIREEALARQRVAVVGLSLAGISQSASESVWGYGRGLLAVIALVIGAVGTYYWHDIERASADAEIDSALLADEVPFSAYLDQGFMAWLYHVSQQRDSEESPQQ